MIKLIAVIAIAFCLLSLVVGFGFIFYMARIHQPRDDREYERLRLQALEELRRQTKG